MCLGLIGIIQARAGRKVAPHFGFGTEVSRDVGLCHEKESSEQTKLLVPLVGRHLQRPTV